MHKLLERQLRRHLGSAPAAPAELAPFLAAISATYEQNDDDRALLDHSMNTVSQELLERNRLLRLSLDEQAVHDQDLEVALALVRGTIESTFDALLVVDNAGRILLTNARFAELWRIPAELIASGDDARVLGCGVEQVQDPEAFLARVQALYADPEATSFDDVFFKDGRVFERYSKPLVVGGRSAGRVWSFRDVTGFRVLQQQLLQSQKMEAVGKLAGGVAHDFNNLMTIIAMHCEFMSGSATHPWRGEIDAIAAAAQRASALTRQLLAFSRKQIMKPVPLRLGAVVTGMESMLTRLIGEDISIVTVEDDRDGVVMADPRQIEQVILNLAVNARDAMPAGGTITIRSAHATLEAGDRRVSTGLMGPGDYVLLSVSDTGIGIPAGIRDRVFEPFFTTKETGQGTGLGLSTVYGIVTQSGGHIALTSEEGQGTTFEVFLPRVTVAAPAPRAAPAGPAQRGCETILLVEDETPLRLAASRMLERNGYRVLCARDAEEAVTIASRPGARFDLLVSDVVLPGVSGRALAERLRSTRPGLPVIFMSGYTDDDIFRRGVLPHDAEFIEKPFSSGTLTAAVRAVLEGRRPGVTPHEPSPVLAGPPPSRY